MKKTVSLCMIARDEEHNIGRCLASVQNAVDEIIVIDTGSKDKTAEIARQYGAVVQSFLWNSNFSDARNASLELASGDWVLFMDADEQLTAESAAVLKRILADSDDVEGYFIKIINFVGSEGQVEACSDLVFRLFKNKPEYRFKGAIHEQIVTVILEHNKHARYKIAEDIIIYHYGYLEEQLQAKHKKDRNMAIVERELAADPGNKLLRYHFGVELYRVHDFKRALAEFITVSRELNPATIYFPKLIRYIVLCHSAIGQHREAADAAMQGLRLFPNYADLYYYAGAAYYELRNYEQAVKMFSQAVRMPEQPAYYASFSGIRGYRAYYYLGQINKLFCNDEEAVKYFVLSLRDNGCFLPSLEELIKLFEPQTDPVNAKMAIDTVFDCSDPKAKLLIAKLLINERAYPLALDYLPADDGRDIVKIYRIVCLIQSRRYFEAMKLIKEYPPAHEQYPVILLNQLLCHWFQDQQNGVKAAGERLDALPLMEDTAKVVQLIVGKAKGKASLGIDGFNLFLDILARTLDAGRPDLAAALMAGLELDGAGSERFHRLGDVFAAYGRLQEAAEYYCRSVSAQKNAEVYLKLGKLYERQGRYIEARAAYLEGLACDPKLPECYIRLIKLYETMKLELLKTAAVNYPEIQLFKELLKEAGEHAEG